jgi:rhamnosyltransferase
MSVKIAACVVLYNPSLQVIANIQSYYQFVDCLIAVDNSEQKNGAIEEALQSNFKHIIYKFLNANLGIAAALNIACTTAAEKGFDWILTMDQDSSFVSNDLSIMIADIAAIEAQYGNVGIITPYHVLAEGYTEDSKEDFTVRRIAMTSGNLLNLKAYQVAGAFEEKLFMDFVDYEYCLRLRKNTYTIIQDNKVKLKHSLGNFHIRHFLGKKLGISNHNYQRRYYMTRNSLLVSTKHYKMDKAFFYNVLLNNLVKDPILILLFEDNKLAKINSIWKGIIHFLLGRTGKIKFS